MTKLFLVAAVLSLGVAHAGAPQGRVAGVVISNGTATPKVHGSVVINGNSGPGVNSAVVINGTATPKIWGR